ncbi:diguanylate cyclase [Pseudooceanicola sp.]|uniref:diguanylate cyclase n=1 Tax=Pseudooceanicola sp. TaxID=1914328 RepID=UPI00263110E7|nr:diguanylate cyclase [Pseudooceanicola sp.]MDF1854848.1 diguanylate cyclase [Pseudooceanicola sp.]
MSGTILLAEETATNRIVNRVLLSAAFSQVLIASSGEQALEIAARQSPDVVLISDGLPDWQTADLCARFRSRPGTVAAALIVLTGDPDGANRACLLNSGADDVFTRGQPAMLQTARLRALIRARGTEEALALRETTERSFGLAEAPAPFEDPGHVALIACSGGTARAWKTALDQVTRQQFRPFDTEAARCWLRAEGSADVVVLAVDTLPLETLQQLIADLRARPASRHAEILLIAAQDTNPALADALDRGASAVMTGGFDPGEAAARINALLRRKKLADRMRRRMQDGLRASVTDALTGLYNRRYAEPFLERLAVESAASQRPFAVVLADIDHFKAVNDTHGHKAGDRVLILVADLLRDNLRAGDLVARFGGEEFLIVMPDTGRAEAHLVADRLRLRLAETPIAVAGQTRRIQITTSIGICVKVAQPGGDAADQVSQMLEQADRALYAAKGTGRNRVELARMG